MPTTIEGREFSNQARTQPRRRSWCTHRDDAHRHRNHVRARKGGRVRLAYGRVLKRGDLGRSGSV